MTIQKLAFISGPALGHVGRLVEIAKFLKDGRDVEIDFFIAEHASAKSVISDHGFPLVTVPVPHELRSEPFESFGTQLETFLQKGAYDLIVQDGCPVRWFSIVRFPDCPRVIITNAFLTGVFERETVQTRLFASDVAEKINRLRRGKDLPELHSAFELYEADKVILADPEFLFDASVDLPENHIFTGPVVWNADLPIPAIFHEMDAFSLFSMGSTGRRPIDQELIDYVRRMSGTGTTIYAGQSGKNMFDPSLMDYQFNVLPIHRVLKKARFVVTQGGAGSTYQALLKGVPVICYPSHENQEILARQLEAKGLAICIGRNQCLTALKDYDPDLLRRNALEFAQKSAPKRGARRAFKLISELLK